VQFTMDVDSENQLLYNVKLGTLCLISYKSRTGVPEPRT
jgi:hypothetical protein